MYSDWLRYRPVAAVALVAVALALLGLIQAEPALARGGGGFGGGGRDDFGGGGGFDRGGGFGGGGDLDRGGNTINTGRTNIVNGDYHPDNTWSHNVNTNNGGWGWGWGGDYAAGVATGAAVGAAAASGPGTVVYSLPPTCTTVVYGGSTYQNCDGTYYQPVYQGANVVYQNVNPP